jgi:hypothetical protein
MEQPLRIEPDPRVKLPLSAYAEQFALAKEIDALHRTLGKAIAEADAQLEQATDEAMKTRIRDLAGCRFHSAPSPPKTSHRRARHCASSSILSKAFSKPSTAPTPRPVPTRARDWRC